MSSLTLFRVRGIPVKAHITLLIAIPYFAFVIAAQLLPMAELAAVDSNQLRLPAYVWGLLLAFGLFVSVTLHELGHTLVALRNGRKVRSITLMLLGGISQIDGHNHGDNQSAKDENAKEGWIAAIGPAVSLGIAVVLFMGHEIVTQADARFGLFYLSQLNMTIAVFNMIPAYPLDGGRVLRAILSHRMGHERATGAAIALSKGFALAFAIFGALSFNLILILVAFFIYSACLYESRMLQLRHMLAGVRASELMHNPLAKITGATSVDQTIYDLAARRQEIAAVVSGEGRFLGVAELSSLSKVPAERRQAVPVGMVTDHDVARIAPNTAAITVVELLAGHGPVAAVVNDDDRLEGFIDADDIRRVLRLRELQEPPRRAA